MLIDNTSPNEPTLLMLANNSSFESVTVDMTNKNKKTIQLLEEAKDKSENIKVSTDRHSNQVDAADYAIVEQKDGGCLDLDVKVLDEESITGTEQARQLVSLLQQQSLQARQNSFYQNQYNQLQLAKKPLNITNVSQLLTLIDCLVYLTPLTHLD